MIKIYTLFFIENNQKLQQLKWQSLFSDPTAHPTHGLASILNYNLYIFYCQLFWFMK